MILTWVWDWLVERLTLKVPFLLFLSYSLASWLSFPMDLLTHKGGQVGMKYHFEKENDADN
jgi:hypothetical protein